MSLVADMKFGTETVKVGDVAKDMDVCQLADEFYDALQTVPHELKMSKDTKASAAVVNEVLERNGFPPIADHTAAYKFSQDVIVRSIELKKAADDVWLSVVEPESLTSIRDSMSRE